MDMMAHRKLCRLCLCQSKCFMDVFDENDSLGFTVAKALEDLLQIKVTGDKYPWLACSTCVEKLIDFRLFKSRCLDSKVTFEKRFCVEEHGPVISPNNEDSDDLEADISHGDEESQIKEEYDINDMCKVIIKMEEGGGGGVDSDENWMTYNDSSLKTDSCGAEVAMETVEKEGTSRNLGVTSSKTLTTTGAADVDVSEENSVWIKDEPVENEESKGTGNTECDGTDYEWPEVKVKLWEPSTCADFHPAPGSEEVPFKVSEVTGGDSISSGKDTLQVFSEVRPLRLNVGGSREQGTNDSASRAPDSPLRNEGGSVGDSIPPNPHDSGVKDKSLLVVSRAIKNENSRCGLELTPVNGANGDGSGMNPGKLRGGLRGHVGSCDTVGKQSVSESQSPVKKYRNTRSGPQCSDCNLRFKSSARLKKHLKWHKSKTPAKKSHECPKCGKAFSYLQCYKTHLEKHAKTVIYQCPKCLKFFGSQELIVTHMKTHVVTRRCQYCDKCFNSETEHVAHELTHSGTREFACVKCDSSFFTLQQLKLHETVHTGGQPFECGVCGSNFKSDETLTEHQQSAHHVRTDTVV